jgi:hypothetical protein
MDFTDEQRDQFLTFLMANTVNDALTLGLSDDLGASVLHVNSAIPRSLNLSIANTVTEQVEIVGRAEKVSTSNYHFHIQFNNTQVSFSANPTVTTPDWHIFVVSNAAGYVTDFYLLSARNITLNAASSKDGTTTTVQMQYAGAMLSDASADVLQMVLTVGANVNALLSPPQPVTGTETIHLTTFTDASAPTPLIPTLVKPRTILIGDDKGSLLLRLVNTSADPVTFVPPLNHGGPTPTSIEISVDVDTTAAALCTPAEAKDIVITPPPDWHKVDPNLQAGTQQRTWLFRPDYSKTKKVDGHLTLDFTLTGIKTTLPPGFTNLYVTLREFPLYGTQTIVVQIEKSPLIYNSGLNSGLLSQGAIGNSSGLALNGNTTTDLLLVNQIGGGNSAYFKGGAGIVVDTDARLNDGVLWLRGKGDKNHGVGVYGGADNKKRPSFAQQDIDGPVVFGFEGGALGTTDGGEKISVSWHKTGAVGINTNEPKSTLGVKGGMAIGSSYADTKMAPANSLLVEGAVSIGTAETKNMLSVKGAMAVGSYADNAAPPNSLLVEEKVGIGTVNPLGPLSVGDSSVDGSDGYIVVGKMSKAGTRQYRMGFDDSFNFVIGDYGYNNKAATWTSPFAMAYSAPSNSLFITAAGHVGIGTKNPLGPLSVGDASVMNSDGYIVVGKMSKGGTRQYRLGFDDNFNFVIGDYGNENKPGGWTAPFAIAWGAPTNSLYINPNGHVGIGTNPTKAALEVTSNLYPQSIKTNFGLVTERGCYSYAQYLPDNRSISIYSQDVFWCNSWVIASSDARIKRTHGVSDGRADLNTLLAIEVTDYSYIDALSNGSKTHKKVIAQQVQKIFPQAVSEATNVVPDIYQKASIKDGWVQLATELKKGERVRLVGEKSDGIHEVLEVGEGQFRTDFSTGEDQVFVYGREVNDFLNVDYDAIAMLNVSATQQIKKEKDAEVQALREENAALRARLEKLEKLMERFVPVSPLS